MIGRVIVTVLLAGLVLLALAVGWYFYLNLSVRESYRQKMTIEVETPQGPVSASSVTAVVQGLAKAVLGHPGGRGYARLTGEAVVLEVAPGRYLFALLDGQAMLAQQVFAAEIGLDREPAARPEMAVWLDRLARLRMSRELPQKLYPLLVTFADIADPKTVRRVEPDNLAASFGPGVRLRAITLEITDEKVTEGRVEAVLGWFEFPNIDPSINAGRKSTFRYPNSSPRGYGTITTLDFMRR